MGNQKAAQHGNQCKNHILFIDRITSLFDSLSLLYHERETVSNQAGEILCPRLCLLSRGILICKKEYDTLEAIS